MNRYCLLLLLSCLCLTSQAQTSFNIELQAYPTGFIPGFRIENQISESTKVHLRLGLNIFDHRDLGVQDEEVGSGYGLTLGIARQLSQSRFDLGIRSDLWFNQVDWVHYAEPTDIEGETAITVLQPTAELSYRIDGNKYSIRPSISFGMEWNVATKGEPTGEGAIVLIGIIVGRHQSE